ncbi:hypothetical protein GCM10009612_63160 [Streptomyces beijiangensis]
MAISPVGASSACAPPAESEAAVSAAAATAARGRATRLMGEFSSSVGMQPRGPQKMVQPNLDVARNVPVSGMRCRMPDTGRRLKV